jgi:hypothetical protein
MHPQEAFIVICDEAGERYSGHDDVHTPSIRAACVVQLAYGDEIWDGVVIHVLDCSESEAVTVLQSIATRKTAKAAGDLGVTFDVSASEEEEDIASTAICAAIIVTCEERE